MSIAIAIEESDIVDEKPLDVDYDALDAILDDVEDRRSPGPRDADIERQKLRAVGAPGFLWADLADPDPYWVAHQCVSNDLGYCSTCITCGSFGEHVPR